MKDLLFVSFVLLLLLLGASGGGGGGGGNATQLAIDISDGNGSYSVTHKFGHNPSVDSSGEMITGLGGTTLGEHLTSAIAVRVKAGGNAADDSDGGAGCKEVTVAGLDETWVDASEVIATEGADASSATTTTFIRLFRAWCSAVGTYGAANTGAITIESTTPTDLLLIAADEGQTQHGAYTIPAGKTGYIRDISGSIQAAKNVNVQLFKRENADDASDPVASKRLIYEWNGVAGFFQESFDTYGWIRLPEKTDIWAEGITTIGTTAHVDIHFVLLVKDD